MQLKTSVRPRGRPVAEAPTEALIAALTEDVASTVQEAQEILAEAEEQPQPTPTVPAIAPRPRPETLMLASVMSPARPTPPSAAPAALPDTEQEVVTRLSSSGGRYWGINLGRYGTRFQADRVLLKTALQELGTLDDALRKVVQNSRGFEANFVGMTQEEADLACRRLQSHGTDCTTFGPRS